MHSIKARGVVLSVLVVFTVASSAPASRHLGARLVSARRQALIAIGAGWHPPGVVVASLTSPMNLERALARERERTRALREVGLLLDSTVPRDELLRRVLAASARVTEAERATLYLVDDDHTTLTSHATEGGGASATIVLAMGEGMAGAAARDRRSVCSPDAYADPRFVRTWDQRSGYRTRAVLASPMLTPDGGVVGVLQVLNRKDGGAFDEDDIAMLEALAAQAAVAFEGARQIAVTVERNRVLTELQARLERSLRERSTLLEMEQLLSRAETLDVFLQGSLDGVARACCAAAGAVFLADDEGSPLTLRAVHGVAPGALAIGSLAAPKTLVARVLRSGEAVIVASAIPAGGGAPESALPGGLEESLLVVPVPGENGPIGVIELKDRRDGPFTLVDLDLLTLVAANMSTGVELAHARRERERATRLAAVGRTLSNVLHDIRTPMTIISGYAQLMPGIESAEERAKFAQNIVRQFDHIQAMIGELLAFVRGESHLLVSRVFLEPFFTETVEVLRQELASRHVALKLDIRDRGAARLDTAKITRLVHNLARNAADALAARGGGAFSITVDREGSDLILVFEDDGPGIPQSIRPLLFESFVTEGKPGGTGLGLAIVKKVVDEHQGSLSVETGSWGTRFTIRLPSNGPVGSVRPPPPGA